ncbi:hypothetical protein [Ekhidna sp.]|uniref:hypothetical protein n=1 Tax=Ekhidna sp. TaxID=2608089 RepID=UPI003512B31B
MENPNRHPFEYNVLMFACIMGLIRSVLAVIGDLDNISSHPDFYTDAAFTLIFCFAIVALRTSIPFLWVLSFFYVPFIGLLIFTFHFSNGLQLSIEQNIFVGLIFIIFSLKGRLMIYLSSILIAGVFLSILLLEVQYDFLGNYQDKHSSDLNFIFASLGIIGITFYAKYVLVKRRDRLRENRHKLQMKTRELSEKRQELEKQKVILEELTLAIDRRVSQRTKALNTQKKRREKYLSILSTELNQNFEKTMASIDRVELKNQDGSFLEMLRKSGNSLKTEIGALKEKVIEGHD